MATYYAKIRIDGVSSSIPVKAEANDQIDAKKIIEAQNGKVKQWLNSPTTGIGGKPPSWFK